MSDTITKYAFDQKMKIIRQVITEEALQENFVVFVEIYGIKQTIRGLSDAIEELSSGQATSELAEKWDRISADLLDVSRGIVDGS